MIMSLAQIRTGWLLPALLAWPLAAGASAPATGGELAAAEQAVARAADADADQYAPELLAQARAGLNQAQAAALDRRLRKQAPGLALRAAADADLAHALSAEAVALAELEQRRSQVDELRRTLGAGENP